MNTTCFYNFYYRFYPFIDFFLFPQKKKIAKTINLLPEGNFLEVGVGNGSILPLYSRHYITAIDTSIKMLSVARSRKTKIPVTFMMMNGEDLSFGNEQFDYVIMNHVLSVCNYPERMIREAYRVLKPHGLLLINNHEYQAYYPKWITKLLCRITSILHFDPTFKLANNKSLARFRHISRQASSITGYFHLNIYQK